MKFLAFLVVAGSLVLGLMSAASAYLVPLTLDDPAIIGLTAADRIVDPTTGATIVERGGTIDAAALDGLRRAEARRVRVEEFSFARWSERWLFLGAIAGLIVGAVLVRRGARPSAAAEAAQIDPARCLDELEATLRRLLSHWPAGGGSATASKATLAALGPVVEDVLPTFPSARPTLVSRLGLGGYASVMDRFSAAERQIHRAWSAAADGVPEESRICVERALVHLGETRLALKG